MNLHKIMNRKREKLTEAKAWAMISRAFAKPCRWPRGYPAAQPSLSNWGLCAASRNLHYAGLISEKVRWRMKLRIEAAKGAADMPVWGAFLFPLDEEGGKQRAKLAKQFAKEARAK